ncbi:MAG TPA: xylulose 5-phosphate 3-epimerase [Nevskia sp.]|nr:xylulose 5-phosphate 3-epimerase [Nevskia sp.]
MTDPLPDTDAAALCRELAHQDPDFGAWAEGYGVIRHLPATQLRVHGMAQALRAADVRGDGFPFYDVMRALDRLASAGLWLVIHAAYARHVHLDGRVLHAGDFKASPQGHLGGSLNMVPAYAGLLGLDVLTGTTRAWLMGQGHCVSAIDSLNALVGNMEPAHAVRYDLSDAGLSRFAQDFYSMRLDRHGRAESPLGSHVNIHTAGSMIEGGFLGFAELLYPHMPLPGERLVAYLSDGAFEEQRGSDWAPRWWRAEDCGLVTPIMIANGRRIDSRTMTEQEGGPRWLMQHLSLNGFEPLLLDGRDPAAFAWAVWYMEASLQEQAALIRSNKARYPVRLPYGVAVAPKGAGFYGEGSNAAHNLPLPGIPARDAESARLFNLAAQKLWVAEADLRDALLHFGCAGNRVRERDVPLARRDVGPARLPEPAWMALEERRRSPAYWTARSPMAAVDEAFAATVRDNPGLRPRFGNPDESSSNHMTRTLAQLRHRVVDVERPEAESLSGEIITALNEEAVVCAALGNKGGINIVVTYEAFAVKMVSALRQELIFADQAGAAGAPPRWLSWPLVLTSHTWENAKNERSHQDPTACEALLAEPSDISRVLFPVDYNSAAATMQEVYRTRGQIWTVVCPKQETPLFLTPEEAQELGRHGALRPDWAGHRQADACLAITAVGAYQFAEALKASARLRTRDIAHAVVCIAEPGRLRRPRSAGERAHALSDLHIDDLYVGIDRHLLVTHTHPEPIWGLLGPRLQGTIKAAGYRNSGGTMSTAGLLYANGCSWMHLLRHCAELLHLLPEAVLTRDELAAMDGLADPNPLLDSVP